MKEKPKCSVMHSLCRGTKKSVLFFSVFVWFYFQLQTSTSVCDGNIKKKKKMRRNWYIWNSYPFTIKGRIWSGRVSVAVVRFSTLAVDKKKLFFPCLIQYEPWLTHVIYWASEVNRRLLHLLCVPETEMNVPQHSTAQACESRKYVAIGLFYTLLNQFYSIAAMRSCAKTVIHCILLTYLASLPGCFSALG